MTGMGVVMKGNLIDSNGDHGILVTASALDVEISNGNVVSNNGGHEIILDKETSALIKQNTIENETSIPAGDEGFNGIHIEGSARIDNNIIRNINGSGIYVHETASDVVITGQNQIKANRTGISVFGSALINDNIISDNLEYGIWIEEPAEQVTLTWNRVEDNHTTGVVILSGTGDVLIKKNVISNNVRGLYSTGEPKLRENTIQHNTEYGIKISVEGIDLGGRIEADSGKNAILDNGWNVINRDSVEIQAIGNYWGTNDPAEIDSTIMDNDEDSLTGPVIFEPFLTDYNVGVQKPYPGEDPDDHGMLKVYPNPVHGKATIQFRLLTAGEVDLCVIGASGRVLQSLISGRYFEPGEHRIQWDGFPGDGRVTPDGIYFVVMKVGHQLVSRKILLMK